MKFVAYILALVLLSIPFNSAIAEPKEDVAYWIAYPGEFGILTHKNLMTRRTERNQHIPAGLYRVDVPYGIIQFNKRITLQKPEKASLHVDGKFYIRGIQGKGTHYDYDPTDFELPAGDYTMIILVENFEGLPAIHFKSPSYVSDDSWHVSALNGELIPAEQLSFTDPTMLPSDYKLAVKPIESIVLKKEENSILYDFGKETFGFPILHNVEGKGRLYLYYGESIEEAMAGKLAETWDIRKVDSDVSYIDTIPTRAFRYVQVVTEGDVKHTNLSADYEYLPLDYRGAFKSSDPLLNKIYDISYYTLHLSTREVHIDGIKRDRWAWSGDAYQSYLMNFYTFFDEDVNKRTMWGLRGHEPQTRHLNSILDYTFYWLIGIYDHYVYTGDIEFIRQIYPRMKSTMDFCLSRLNENGIAEGQSTDWVFVDWAPIQKTGELSFEQLLFIKSLEAMKVSAELVEDKPMQEKMTKLYSDKINQFNDIFWQDAVGAYLHRRVNGKLSEEITRYTNMFAILLDIVSEERKQKIKHNVLLNDSILAITTPYMKFYELAALCEIGEHKYVLDYVKDYWGGMIDLGATSFWEAYDPSLPDNEHYAMYDRPFGKSLCHAWGANPVYLFGKYYLGIKPTKPGYREYIIEPNLANLKWMEGTVPTPIGDIKLSVETKKIIVHTPDSNGGVLRFTSSKKPKVSNGILTQVNKNEFELKLNQANSVYEINR
ncbi:alpha-rhamnosidase [Dysgonomonas sp. Marseille-P4677]|uniref:alpha-L-rhamnosidase-related protein n=1 Tax=Dysgonomonas sp. Marseille-P4677 TaxID=2364790 RepID=UPI0019149779|nr:GH116 family glycosyl hydrolase [Dysgonomonas sp. Marseille-P4677]MBK5719862.1 alpha-rhamnosidase [Dysgonomonas sp. Marseille-P4677]